MTEESGQGDFPEAENAAAWASVLNAWGDSRTPSESPSGESTGVGGKDDEPIGDGLGEGLKGLAFSARMATDLALVEDQ